MRPRSFEFDVAYTSVLKRAIGTLWHVLGELDLHWIPVHRDWRLNERHYGALQGLNKAETAEKHGDQQVKIWRRSYATPPPALEASASTRCASHSAPGRSRPLPPPQATSASPATTGGTRTCRRTSCRAQSR